jgi:hypothetical protein
VLAVPVFQLPANIQRIGDLSRSLRNGGRDLDQGGSRVARLNKAQAKSPLCAKSLGCCRVAMWHPHQNGEHCKNQLPPTKGADIPRGRRTTHFGRTSRWANSEPLEPTWLRTSILLVYYEYTTINTHRGPCQSEFDQTRCSQIGKTCPVAPGMVLRPEYTSNIQVPPGIIRHARFGNLVYNIANIRENT